MRKPDAPVRTTYIATSKTLLLRIGLIAVSFVATLLIANLAWATKRSTSRCSAKLGVVNNFV